MEIPSLNVEMANRPRGWRLVDVEYSCIPDAVYPWDPAVLRAIWEFDPEVVPMWQRWIFRPPFDDVSSSDVLVVGRHAVARHKPHLVNEAYPFPVTMPDMPCQGVTFGRPNIIEFMLAKEHKQKNTDLPGEFVPWDWDLYSFLRARYTAETDGEKLAKQFIERRLEAERKSKASRDDDLNQREKDWHKYADKKLEQVSDVEWAEFYRSGGVVEDEKKISVSVPEAQSESGPPADSQGV